MLTFGTGLILLHFNKVILVGYDYNLYVGLGVLIDLFEPVVEIEERLSIEKIEDEHDAIRSFVVSIGDGPISLLSSCIPNLKLNLFTIMSERSESEVNSDGGHVVLVELVICEPDKEAGLADAGISKKNHLEKMVIILS